MSDVRFMGCLHFRHLPRARSRGFETAEKHDEYLIQEWNKIVKKEDLTYILGDITMENPKYYLLLNLLKGRKKVILGNHEKPKDVFELLKYVETVSGCENYKGFLLTHVPIHPSEVHLWKGNIHAHIHEEKLEETIVNNCYFDDNSFNTPSLHKYANVDAYQIGFKPKKLDELF